jgi:hypothetical protein
MNIKNVTALDLILITSIFNIHAMETPSSDTTQKFVNAMETSEFASITQTPKFQAIIQRPEFWVMMQTPQFQAFLMALNSKSYARIQKSLEDLLETEALEDLFKTGIFSDEIRVKHNAMKQTEAYAEYQGAKQLYTEGGLTQDMVDDCKSALRSTQEYNDLIDAANAEMFITNNSMNNNSTYNFSDMEGTEEYQVYEIAKKCHAKHNTSETEAVMDETLELLLETQASQHAYKTKAQENYNKAKQLHETYNTPQTKTIMEEGLKLVLETEKSKNNSSQEYSHNVITKNFAMEQTPEHQQYKQAKLAYEQNPNEDTKYMLDLCKAELHNTKECLKWLDATDQEPHVFNNILNSEKWQREQKHLSFQDIAALQKNRNIAWITVQKTKEYEVFKKAELAHQLHGTLQSASLLKRCQEHAKETQEYKKYFELDQQLRAIKEQPEKHNIHVVQLQPRSNIITNDCFIQPEGPKIDIQLIPNNNCTPRTICVPQEIRLQLTNNKNNNNA